MTQTILKIPGNRTKFPDQRISHMGINSHPRDLNIPIFEILKDEILTLLICEKLTFPVLGIENLTFPDLGIGMEVAFLARTGESEQET